MKNIFQKCMSSLNEKLRFKIYRKLSSVPADSFDPQITLEIATTTQDLQQAYSLLHNCYVGINIIPPQPSGLRCNLFSFLPNTTTLVAKKNGVVIGTVSLIRDSAFGLPSDKEFFEQNSEFRKKGQRLVEVSALAVRSDYRNADHSISLLLMKYLYNFTKKSFHADHLVAIVHPKAEDFYRALWQFKRNGPVVRYNSLNKALGVHLTMDLSDSHLEKIVLDFNSNNPQKNLALFCTLPDNRFHYPKTIAGKSIYPVLTPEIVNYFCATYSDIWSQMSPRDQNNLVQIYATYFGSGSINIASTPLLPNEACAKDYRTPLRIQSLVHYENQSYFATISDLSSGGCFIEMTTSLLLVDTDVEISFKLNGKSYKLEGCIAWKSESNKNAKANGAGIRFLASITQLNYELRDWLYSDVTTKTKAEATLSRIG